MPGALRPIALAVALAAAILPACEASRTPAPPPPSAPRPLPVPPAPGADELANATYSGIYPEPITLVDGSWEGEPFEPDSLTRPWVGLAPDFRLVGDLDGRPGAEAVVLLTENSGGSGSFVYVAAVGVAAVGVAVEGRRAGEPVNLGTAYVGDRAEVRSGRIANGKLVLSVVEGGPGDAACCPSQKATRIFALSSETPAEPASQGASDGLVEISHEVTGTLSLADLEGVEWVLTDFSAEQPAPATPELTLRFEGARISGSSGCNRYFAAVESGKMPSDIQIGPIGSTRMMCPEPQMLLEQQYLAALEKAMRYGFARGRLYLLSSGGGGFGDLLFESRPITSAP